VVERARPVAAGAAVREGVVDGPEPLLAVVMPVIAVLADAGVADPALLAEGVGTPPALDPVGVDADELVLVGDLGRAGVGGDGGAAGRQHQQVAEPVPLGVVGVAVQEEVQPRGQDLLQVGGVAQVLVVGHRAPDDVVVQHPDPQPAALLERAQALGEPAELPLPDPAMVVAVAVALGHGGVQPGDHQPQLGQLEQGPRLVDVEADGLLALVEAVEHGCEQLPLGPEGHLGLLLVGFALEEVGLAGGAADVVVAGDDQHPAPGQPQGLAERLQERPHLLELARPGPLGQVAGDHHQVGVEPVGGGQPAQIDVEAREQRVPVLVVDGQAAAAEQMVAPELRVGKVQQRDRIGHCAILVPRAGTGKPGRMAAPTRARGDPDQMPTDHGPELEALRKRLGDAKEFL
jgi:hypothetical protein